MKKFKTFGWWLKLKLRFFGEVHLGLDSAENHYIVYYVYKRVIYVYSEGEVVKHGFIPVPKLPIKVIHVD